jgi:endonuclease/exonuclease/phosphatase family metal-dependent hydrolase
MKKQFVPALVCAALTALTPALASANPHSSSATPTVSRASAAAPTPVRVASFNVVGISLDSYQGSQSPWKLRRDTIVRQILNGHTDVVGVQEVNPSNIFRNRLVNRASVNQYFDLRNGLNHFGRDTYALQTGAAANCVNATTTYRCVYRNRRASGSDRILYNTRTLRQTSYGYTRFSRTTAANRAAGVTWSKLRVRATGAPFLFVTTHLDPRSRSVRLAQWKQLISVVNSVKGSRPVIATGDYNANRADIMTRTMLPAMKRAGYGDVLGQEYGVSPSRGMRAENRSHAWVNSINRWSRYVRSYSYDDRRTNVGQMIDYVFASNKLRVTYFKTVLSFGARNLLVSGRIPSDHNMLRATVLIP